MPRADRRRFRRLLSASVLALAARAAAAPRAQAQDKGEPGKFDFYLMNVAWGPEFCHVPGAGPQCRPPHGFVLHGLWTQFNNGTYPVFCSSEAGPKNLARFFDLTPDLPLLQHEWDKHGTCAAVGPDRFFRMEQQAFHSLRIPPHFKQANAEMNIPTADILAEFRKANPAFPDGSILLSCAQKKLTAVEACFSKDLKPMRCQGLHSCEDRAVTVEANTVRPKP